MDKKTENLYLKLPAYLQNLIITAYGIKMQRIQKGHQFYNYIKRIENDYYLSKKNIVSLQLKKLKYTIKEAATHVPYYRDLFQHEKLKIEDIKEIKDIEKIPMLDKKTIKENPERFINEKYNKKKLYCINTSGTTGTPIKIFYNSDVRQLNYAFYDRFLDKYGLSKNHKIATFGGRILMDPAQKEPPFWRCSYLQKNTLFSSYHLTDKNIPYYIEKLKNLQPKYIDSYPSCIYTIAKYMAEKKISGENITQGIVTSAETLFPEQRKVIEKVFGVKVADQYGCTEMCVFAGQCKEGNYHIGMDYGIVEFLNERNKSATSGEEAELVCTGFVNYVMPLIRYRIGDKGIFTKKQCNCGCKFDIIKQLTGRIDDMIVTPDGRKVSRFGSVLYKLPVNEVQYVQEERNSLIVNIVKGNGYDHNTEKIIKKELRNRLGDQLFLNFKYLEKIPREKRGKLKTIISKLH
jgi:phenylacetate-CoA ligase